MPRTIEQTTKTFLSSPSQGELKPTEAEKYHMSQLLNWASQSPSPEIRYPNYNSNNHA